MHSPSAVVLFFVAFTSAGQLQALKPNPVAALAPRQTTFVNAETCEDGYGSGWKECVTSGFCYNPDLGQICCANANYCDSDQYCASDSTGSGLCCPDGASLQACGATTFINTASGSPKGGSPPNEDGNSGNKAAIPGIVLGGLVAAVMAI